jgi:hypothetical protein
MDLPKRRPFLVFSFYLQSSNGVAIPKKSLIYVCARGKSPSLSPLFDPGVLISLEFSWQERKSLRLQSVLYCQACLFSRSTLKLLLAWLTAANSAPGPNADAKLALLPRLPVSSLDGHFLEKRKKDGSF